jgi:NADH-quinone oxidoreductase subunit E
MILQTVEDELKVPPDETTQDGLFTFTVVACLGCCSLAPVLMIDDETHGRMTPQTVRRILRQYRQRAGQSPKATASKTGSAAAPANP